MQMYGTKNGEHKTKNLIVDNVEITLRNNSVSKVDIINSGDEAVDNVKSNTILIVVIVLSAILVTSAVIIIAGKVRSKKRNWKRLWKKQLIIEIWEYCLFSYFLY